MAEVVQGKRLSDKNEKQMKKEDETEGEKENGQPITDKIRAYASILAFFKYFCGGFLVWSFGRLDFNYIWLFVGIIAYTLWKCYLKDKKMAKEVASEILDANDVSRLSDLPKWVFFPDVERAEWLNKFIAQLWPYVNEMVIKIIKDTVEPQIQKSVPGMLKSIYFKEISLGNQPPRVGGIKVYTENVKRSEVIMDIDLIYSGDADFELSVKCVTVGIEDLQVRGTLRVIMAPLVPASPLVGGMSVFFLDKPELDFNLTNLLNVLDVPGLSDILRGAIGDVIASFCVLPNRIPIPLLGDVSVFDLKYPMPKGVLRVEIVEARDLEKKDIGFLKKGSADPFITIKVGAESSKTEVKKNTLSPTWNETFEFFVDNPQGQKVKLQMYDYDKASDNESMGYVEMDISVFAAQGISDLWIPLEDTSSGEVHLICTWFELSSDPEDLMLGKQGKDGKELKDMLATAALFVKLDSAKKLPVVNKVKRSTSAMCKLILGNKTVESQVIEDTVNPVWDEFHRFLVFNAKYQELDIEVIDNNKERTIGTVEIPLSCLIDEDQMSCERPFPLKDSGVESSIVCEVKLRALVNRKVKYDVSDAVADPIKDKASAHVEEEPAAKKETSASKPSQPEVVEPIPAAKSESEEKVRLRKPAPSSPTESKVPPGEITGEIELSLSHKDKSLSVAVKAARKLTPCDSDGLADPYVRLYLLPDKSKSSRRKTDVVKNSLNPQFNETFDWSIEKDEIPKRTLEVIVKNDVSFFSRSRTTIGRVEINLAKIDLNKGITKWFTLSDEPDSD